MAWSIRLLCRLVLAALLTLGGRQVAFAQAPHDRPRPSRPRPKGASRTTSLVPAEPPGDGVKKADKEDEGFRSRTGIRCCRSPGAGARRST